MKKFEFRDAKRKLKDFIKKILTRRYHISMSKLFDKKRYYIIRRNAPWAGFFANYLYVLAHMQYAKRKGYIPVIDMENYRTYYNEDKIFKDTMNAWEYYFSQPYSVGLKEAYSSNNYVISDISTMHEYLPYKESKNHFEIDWIKGEKIVDDIQNHVILKGDIKKEIDDFVRDNYGNQVVLGVHYRGTDKKKKVANHFLAADLEEYINTTKQCLKENKIDRILLCTDDEDAIEKFNEEFPGKVFFSNSYRAEKGSTEGIHITKNVNRENHNYLLGKEVLCDVYYLANCDYLIFSHSNVAVAAILINNKKYKNIYLVKDK